MRDAVLDRLYELSKKDEDVIFITEDMGSKSMDKFRRNLKRQFINIGIAEQNMIALAAGLTLSNKKVYVYSIIPFNVCKIVLFSLLLSSIFIIPT